MFYFNIAIKSFPQLPWIEPAPVLRGLQVQPAPVARVGSVRACIRSGGKFVVSCAGEAYDARTGGLIRNSDWDKHRASQHTQSRSRALVHLSIGVGGAGSSDGNVEAQPVEVDL
jgi:hypothetical protein